MIARNSIGVQLYSVREQLAQDYEGTIARIASMGYPNVETTGFPDVEAAQKAKALYDANGLNVCATHSAMPVGDDANKIMDIVGVLGCEYIICPYLDPETYFTSMDGVKKACEMLNQANEAVKGAGLTLAYHNHWFEMDIIEGKPAIQHMVELLDESIKFELDVYWVTVGGQEPLDLMNQLGERIPLLHVKDGPAQNREQNMTAVGKGYMDIEAILGASQSKWHVVELDRCDTDMLEAVGQSYDYVQGLSE